MRRSSASLRRLLVLGAAMLSVLVLSPAPAMASHGNWHQVTFYSLTCWARNDPSGDDEPYLKLSGSRIWENPDCASVQTIDLGGLTRSFWHEADLYIMEDDFGSDDTVGYIRLGPQQYQGVQTYYSYKMTPTGYIWNYELRYQVY